MNKKTPRDPGAAYVRAARRKRRLGPDAKCACGESRPEALISTSNPVTCQKCDREKKGMTTMDNHHPAGKANSPVTVPIPVNDHCEMSEAQRDWPKRTLENPEGSPLLAAAGCIRGFKDTVLYLLDELVIWIADMLERLDAHLQQKLGPKWWKRTEIADCPPKQ